MDADADMLLQECRSDHAGHVQRVRAQEGRLAQAVRGGGRAVRLRDDHHRTGERAEHY